MTERTAEYRVHKAPREGPARRLLEGAPRQPAAEEAWKDFTLRLAAALAALEEDEYLLLQVKGTSRYVQLMDQGAFGLRVESVSDYYLPEGEHLGVEDLRTLLGLGWRAPTQVPGTSREDADGSPNYHIDLARPVPLEEVAAVVVLTLRHVHRAGHPGMLEYEARSTGGVSIRFPQLMVRRRVGADG
jgi:hypothetical protein